MVSFSLPPETHSLVALENLTNRPQTLSTIFSRSSSPARPQTPLPPQQTRSVRRVARIVHSSESLPNHSYFIHDAEAVETNLDENDESPIRLDMLYPRRDVLTRSPTAEPYPSPSGHAVPAQDMDWRMDDIDPIDEPSNPRSSHDSVHIPQLSDGPARPVQLLQPKESVRSVHPLNHSSKSLPARPEPAHLDHLRSLSLNDLHTLNSPVKGFPFKNKHTASSTTSADVLNHVCPCPTGPLRPVHPPPYRVCTPPGVPSFGTPEALRMRLESPRSESQSIFTLHHHPNRPGSPASGSANSTGSPDGGRAPPMDMLKRILGITRPVNSPSDMQRTSLPSHVQALARADDGTYVRGTFGGRASGHGVGRMGLERHPLQIAVDRQSRGETGRTEEGVRMINKASETGYRDWRNQTLNQPRPVAPSTQASLAGPGMTVSVLNGPLDGTVAMDAPSGADRNQNFLRHSNADSNLVGGSPQQHLSPSLTPTPPPPSPASSIPPQDVPENESKPKGCWKSCWNWLCMLCCCHCCDQEPPSHLPMAAGARRWVRPSDLDPWAVGQNNPRPPRNSAYDPTRPGHRGMVFEFLNDGTQERLDYLNRMGYYARYNF